MWLSSQLESQQLQFITSAFRLLALILPPKNRRKLHFLLRFLYKLKTAEHITKNLGLISKQIGPTDHQQPANTSRSQQVELFIFESFLSSIVAVGGDSNGQEYQHRLGLKLAQLFVNNYSEIMAIPNEFMTSIKQKLTALNSTSGDDESSSRSAPNNKTLASESCSAIVSSKIGDNFGTFSDGLILLNM